MFKLIGGSLLAIVLMTGCSSSPDRVDVYEANTSNVLCTFKGDVNGFGGDVEVKCITASNSGESFIVTHEIDGDGYNTIFPTSFTTDNLRYVTGTASIPGNSSDGDVVNTISVIKVNESETAELASIDILQSNYEDNIDIVVNVANNIDINNTLVIDTNATLVEDANVTATP
jgi:hypothetical protein